MRVTSPRLLGLGGVLAMLVGGQQPAFAQAANIQVDGTAPGAAVNPVWSYFGYDEANTTTTQQSQDLLDSITKMMDAQVRVRTHFLLNTTSGAPGLKWGATNVYTEDAQGTPQYDWTVMDQIMDAITKTGARPYAQIAFMPQALTRATGSYRNSAYDTLDGGLFYPPKDNAWEKWGALVQAWATHTKERYADAEKTWIWELWNEPNISYWHGTAAEYHKLYDYTERAVHAVFPTSPLGGPETAGVGADFLKGFLTHCDTGTNATTGQTGTRLDYVTFHAKGGVAMSDNHVRMDLGNQLAQHLEAFKIVAASNKFKTAPIVIGEADPDGCAACSAPPANAYRTKAAYGVYEMAMMKHSLALAKTTGVKLQGVTTWAWMFENVPYFANYRQLATNGVPLPVLNGFKMLGQLRGNDLPLTSSAGLAADAIATSKVRGAPDINGMAALDGQHLRVVVWNYHDDLVDVTPAQVSLTVTVPAAFGTSVKVTQQRFDEERASSTAKWVALGKPAQPSADQLLQLRAASELVTLEPAHDVAVQGGKITATFELPRSGAALFSIDGPAATGGAGGGGGGGGASGGGSAGGAGTELGGSAGTTTTAGSSSAGSGGGVGPTTGGAAAAGAGAPAAQGGESTSNGAAPASSSGCGCRTAQSSGSGLGAWLVGIALVGVAGLRRRVQPNSRLRSRSSISPKTV